MSSTYYLAQNTGWSNRVSWFDDGQHYDTLEQAMNAVRAQKKRLGTSGIDHRVQRVTVETDNFYLDKRTEERHLKKEAHDERLYDLLQARLPLLRQG